MRNRIAFFTKLIKRIRFVGGWEKFQNLYEYIFRGFQANSEFKYEKNTANKEDELYLEEVYGL